MTEIHRATTEDVKAMAWLHAAGFDRGWSRQEFSDLMETPGAVAVIAGKGSSARGFALGRVAADEAEMLAIAVAPDAQRQGLGKALVARLEEECAAEGARRMFLDVSETNHAARRLYDGAGYHEDGRRKAYYADGADALSLSKSLPRP